MFQALLGIWYQSIRVKKEKRKSVLLFLLLTLYRHFKEPKDQDEQLVSNIYEEVCSHGMEEVKRMSNERSTEQKGCGTHPQCGTTAVGELRMSV